MIITLIVLLFLLIISVIGNVILVKYCLTMVNELQIVKSIIRELVERIAVFYNHIESVNKMKLHFKDDVLINLLRHTKELFQFLDVFRKNGLLDEPTLSNLEVIERFGISDQNDERNDETE